MRKKSKAILFSYQKLYVYLFSAFLFCHICIGYFHYYGIGQDILALEEITKHKNYIYWNPLEFIIDNIGYVTNSLSIPVQTGIIFLQILGALLNLVALKKILPNSFTLFYLILPNLYLSSFSTVQMNLLIPIWFLFLHTSSKRNKYLYAILGLSIHWFMIILLIFALASRVSTKNLLFIVGILICVSNSYFLEMGISIFEFAVGGARYTNFLLEYTDTFDEVNIILGLGVLIIWVLVSSKNPENYISKKHLMKIKTSFLIAIFAILIYGLGVSVEYTLRIINLTLLPVLSLILMYKKLGSYPLVLLAMYFILTMNLTFKYIA